MPEEWHSSHDIDNDNDDNDDRPKSKFTHRDLRLLSQYSVKSPLRVIALVDFDCFYAQCETVRLGLPDSQPLGVQQFNHVIAINYPARAAGLKKVVTAVEAKQKCPDIVLQHVPTWREGDDSWRYRDDVLKFMDEDKSSLDYYRLQSRRAMDVVKRVLPSGGLQRVEKAGIDETFLDLSAQIHGVMMQRYPGELGEVVHKEGMDVPLLRPPTEILDWEKDQVFGTDDTDEDTRVLDWDDVALCIGAEIVRNIRAEIRKELRYTCSAGIAHNKVVAKLAAGHNKPNKQTVIRGSCVQSFLSGYKFTKLRGLGGKLGNLAVQKFSTDQVSELLQVSMSKMQAELGSESGAWVYRVIRGIEYSEVVSRTQIKSMASAKTFNPTISGMEQAERWLQIFAADIMGRVEEQEGRRPRTIAVHHQPKGRFGPTLSKQAPIPTGSKLDIQFLLALARSVLLEITFEEGSWPCRTLSISVSDFFDTDTTSQSLKSLWQAQDLSNQSEDRVPKKENLSVSYSTAPPKKRTMFDYQVDTSTTTNKRLEKRLVVGNDIASKRRRSNTDSEHTITRQVDEVDGSYRCPQCSKLVLDADVLEHLDWHVAFDLQNQG